MTGISVGIVALLVTLRPAPPLTEPVSAARPANQREATIGPDPARPLGRITLPKAPFARDLVRVASPSRARRSNSGMVAGGIALIVAGAGMVTINSLGVAEGTTIPPGGERDGYLGKPGIVIGSGLVIIGAVLLYRAHRHP